MGNDISCVSTVSTAVTASTTCTARGRSLITLVSALHGTWAPCHLEEPVNVGELMLEIPGHFVSEFGEPGMIQKGQCMVSSRRISALPADRNLCAHHIYFLLPIDRLNTRLTAQELRNIIAASRLASVCIAAPSSSPATTYKTALISSHQIADAVASAIARERALRQRVLHANMVTRCRDTKMEEKLHLDQEEEAEAAHFDSESEKQPPQSASLHKHKSLLKHRFHWAPKLDTIMELTV